MPTLLDQTTAPRSQRTLIQMRSRVRRDLGMLDSTLFTDIDINDWLNEAQDELAREVSWYRTSQTMGTTAGQKEYSLPNPVAGRCIRIEEVQYNTLQLACVTLQQLVDMEPFFRNAGNGTPYLYYVRGSAGFGLHYTPDTTSASNLLVIITALPPQMSLDADTAYVPYGLERGLIIYAKKLASEKDITGEGMRRVQMYEGQWQQFLKDARQQVNSAAERQITCVGEQGLYWDADPWGLI